MHILSTLLAIHALSAGALATPAFIDGRSGGFGTFGQDAGLTIHIWEDENCMPTLEWNVSFDLSWGVMRPLTIAAQSFTISRTLHTTEHLDWSSTVPGPPGANRIRSESVPHGCEYFVKSTDMGPIGRDLQPMPLQATVCTPLGGMPISVSVPSG